MSELTIRRSASTDAKALSSLVDRLSDMLIPRYSRKDLPQLLEDSILSFTVLSEGQPAAIACFSYPKQEVYYSYRQLSLAFYAAETQHTNEAARLILRTVFESQPCIDTIITKVQPTSPLESALVPFFVDDGDYMKCSRETVLPSLLIRAARVEDYDDLMPLFEAEAPDLIQEYGQFFVSDLIKSENTKCLVAEGHEGRAVAFAGLEPEFDPTEHKDSYDLEAFQDLFKEKKISFRIRIFFIAEEYRNHSRDFMKPIFALMRDADYCLMFLPTNSPPFPLAPFFTRIPAYSHGNERFVLYLCHRDSVTDVMLSVRRFTADDYSLLENFIEPLANRTEILEICNEHPENVYQLMANEIVAGICMFNPPEVIDHQNWDIEQYVEIGACSKHCQLLNFTISPIFERFLNFFLVRCMELLEVHALYYMHTKEEMLDDLIGKLFLAIERRQGPAPFELEKHLQRSDTMHLFARKYALQPKFEINTSIVVVGSTEAVASFVYKLISVPYLHFSAIHVVCTGGAERIWVNTAASREYPPDWLQHLHLLNAINFFEADLAQINREEDEIVLNDGTIVCYDFLILLTAKEGEIADMMAKNFVENTQPPVSVVGDSLVAYYILSHYPGAAHIAHNPRFKLEGTMATIIRDSTVAYCDFKEVPPVLLDIIERSFLVYDGGIVIDELFRTNDTKIFAAGPITQFSRLYRVKDDGNVISQTEYGKQIGGVILRYVDPLDRFEEPPPIVGSDDVKNLVKTKGPQSVPKFSTRRAEMYQLPGNRIFYRNGFPSTKCRCLETSKQGQSIRFYIDNANFIQAFEYLGDADPAIFNWIKFIGLPGVLMNNMIERYDKKMITDFKAFFNEPWCKALLHDRFPKFFETLHQELIQHEDVDTPEVHNEIRMAMMQFLIDNADLLPDYYTSESQLPPLSDDDEKDGAK